MSSFAWVSISAPDAVDLRDIMLEEKLQLKEAKTVQNSSVTNNITEKFSTSEHIVTPANGKDRLSLVSSDEQIDKLLQQQLHECNALKVHKNSSKNKTVNIPILSNDYKADLHNLLDIQVESEDDENIEDFRDHENWDQSDMAKEEISKHDIIVCNKRGTEFVMSKADNGLKLHWKQDETNQTLQRVNGVTISDWWGSYKTLPICPARKRLPRNPR